MRRPQRWAVAVGLCLLGPAVAAAHPVEGQDEPPPPVPAAAEVTATPDPDPRAGWRHEFSPAWHMATARCSAAASDTACSAAPV